MVKIIAELCQNHNGDKKLMGEMVAAAAEAGVEYVKIQSMQSKDLTKRSRFEKGLIEGGITKVIKRPFKEEYNRLKNLDLSLRDQSNFIELCFKYNVKPMTTVFSLNRIKELNKLNFDTFKVASFDCSSFNLIKQLSETKKNLIISTGGTYLREIIQTAEILKKRKKNFTFLHCISIYPTPLHEANLSRIKLLKKINYNVGISDHSSPEKNGNQLSLAAILYGATIIERHFTILEKDKTRDGIVSVNFNQLKNLVNQAKKNKNELKKIFKNKKNILKKMCGNPYRELSESELLNRDYYKGRFASKDSKGKIIYNW
tara:strand:+ start:2482 stop:3426 length:945 start_codon:yes stop_codon:yes gene_type:complete